MSKRKGTKKRKGPKKRGGTKKRKGTRKRGGTKRRKGSRKGTKSKSRRGRKNYITHKGDKDYNARGHRQVKRRSPYSRRR
jgi:hypothetical protein